MVKLYHHGIVLVMKKALKMVGLFLIGIIALTIITIILFINISPQFGGQISKKQKEKYALSKNYIAGKFINKNGAKVDGGFGVMVKIFKEYLKPQPNSIPLNNINTNKIDSTNLVKHKGETRLFWFGHSTFLVEIEDKKILIDPMMSEVPSPHPWLGTKRFSKELPIEIEKLPKIDAVILSHDHYDHLDYESILKLKDKVNMFYTPLGVGAHLIEWGINKDKIIELDWWENATYDNITFRCTPAQHFSGRGLTDRGNTLWASWIIASTTENIFFSGDSGYGKHFKEIGSKYGPFDFAMMECGQYNELWKEIHMFPEETVQAAIDLKAQKIMPIHWGAFKLSLHSWTDPVERVTKKAKEMNLDIVVPMIGEPITFSDKKNKLIEWWK